MNKENHVPIDFSNFHLLRPELLLLFIPLLIALFGVRHLAKKQSSWQNVISPHLLKFLMVSGEKHRSYVNFWLTALLGTLIILAVSGPSIREKSVPVFQAESARVILLDLSLSMDATDIKPARIERARHKIMDLLEQTDEGTIGLVVYAGDAFIISPLTSDANTIASMVPTLSTGIMPVLGSRPDIAINKAIELLSNAKQPKGQIIWITDGIEEEFIDSVSDSIKSSRHLISILAVGTEQGAPIPLRDNNGFLKDNTGNIILPKLESGNLKQVARLTNGQYVELSADEHDIEFILSALEMNTEEDSSQSGERISKWIDDGYWFTWIILCLMFVKLFRRAGSQLMSIAGLLVGFTFMSLLIPNQAQAGVWDDLWKTRDQQASDAFKQQEYQKAAELFQDEKWQASASYKQGDYDSALQQFSKSNDLESVYNQANSLAKSQQLEKAIEQYNQVIENTSDNKKQLVEDAEFNKKIVEELLKQQQEQEKQDQESQDQENKDKEESDSNSDSESNSEQDSDEQSDEEKNSEQQEQEEQQSQQESEEQAEEKQAELSEDQRDQNEKDQALEHWLEKIPDDPGGLLRRKMYREYQRRGRQQTEKKVW